MNRRAILILLCVCYALTVFIRLCAPTDIDDRDQAKQGLYVIDVVYNGRYFLPTMLDVEPATKPPLYNWVAGIISFVYGDVTELTIRLPAILCGLGVVLITFLIGELLISERAGLFAGLMLISNFHFVALACTARTDMMLCLLITLSLLFFLYAYEEPSEKRRNFHVLMLFLCLGLGTITKGPVAPALVAVVVIVFLFFKKDLKWLKTVPLGLGLAILVLIALTWFLLAFREGGREFFEITVLDETVNRFLGIGTRADKTRPFYYLVVHFFGRFLPWSFFVPTALIRCWKSEDKTDKKRLFFPVVWFLGVLVFFSISKGKRSDYILPTYPAASLVVAWLWLSLSDQAPNCGWWKQLRAVVGGYAAGCTALVALLAAFAIVPGAGDTIARVIPDASEKTSLLLGILTSRVHLFLLIAIPLGVISIVALVSAVKGKTKGLLTMTLVVSALSTVLYFQFLSSKAMTHSGEQKKAFCDKVAEQIDGSQNIGFLGVKNSIPFYLKKNITPLTHEEALDFLKNTVSPFLITTESEYLQLAKTADFEIIILEDSGYLRSEKQRYVLLGRQPEVESEGHSSRISNTNPRENNESLSLHPTVDRLCVL